MIEGITCNSAFSPWAGCAAPKWLIPFLLIFASMFVIVLVLHLHPGVEMIDGGDVRNRPFLEQPRLPPEDSEE